MKLQKKNVFNHNHKILEQNVLQSNTVSFSFKDYCKEVFVCPINTRFIAMCGLLSAITLLFLVFQRFLPALPQGGTLQLYLVPLLLVGWLYGFIPGLVVGVVTTLLSFLVGTYVTPNPWGFLLDNWLPFLLPALIAFFRYWSINKWNYVLMIFVPVILCYLSTVLSGYLFYSTYAWKGFGAWTYSFVYNAIYYIATFILLYSVMGFCFRTLKIFKL